MSVSKCQSQVAQLVHRIDMEYQAAQRGLMDFAEGSSKHEYITRYLENIGACHEQLAQLISSQQATQLICDAMEQALQAVGQ
jgi:hypothetical protein